MGPRTSPPAKNQDAKHTFRWAWGQMTESFVSPGKTRLPTFCGALDTQMFEIFEELMVNKAEVSDTSTCALQIGAGDCTKTSLPLPLGIGQLLKKEIDSFQLTLTVTNL